jgi:O-Antigen ligase
MNKTLWNNILRYLQFTGFALLIASLPLSNFFMSVSMFWLAGVWLLQVITDAIQKNPLKARFSRFVENRNALLLTSFFILPILGLLWTEDFGYASWDLRMKIPILFMPFVLTTLNPISSKEYRALLGIFLLSLTFAVLWCLLIFWGVNKKEYQDVREISVFISHVRFSLLLIMGIFILLHEAWTKQYGKILTAILTILFLYFIYVIGSMTGMIVLFIATLYMLIGYLKQEGKKKHKILGVAVVSILSITTIIYAQKRYHAYFNVDPAILQSLEKTTRLGEVYEHNLSYPVVEDGHYVMTHIAWGEMYSAWLERSNINPDSLDGRGHVLKGTLIRYLASKGLYKDSDGIAALNEQDVHAIEAGVTGIHEGKKSGLHKRLDNIFFELANYRAGGTPNGHSVFQRLEFWRTASHIIRANALIGVGTGDVKKAFHSAYEEMNSPLESQYRLRAHNQYLTIWLTYGIIGLIWFLIILIAPFIYDQKKKPLLAIFLIIASMSFLTEDTLESQAGVMFVVFFYMFFSLKKKASLSEFRLAK